MPFQIYRFEVLKELSRDGANVVYEARDPVESTTIQLYEWTPPARDSSAAAAKLAQSSGKLDSAEAFSSGQRLYLAAPADKARNALEVMRSHALFTGSWPGVLEDAKPKSDPSIHVAPAADLYKKPPSKSVEEETKPQQPRNFFAYTTTVLALACIGLWAYGADWRRQRDDALADVRSSMERIKQLQDQIDGLKSASDKLNSELARQKQLAVQRPLSDPEADVLAQLRKESDSQAAAAKFFRGEEDARNDQTLSVYTLVLQNNCPTDTLSVALHYQSLQGIWVTRGWWKVASGQATRPEAYSRSRLFYLYADGNGRSWNGAREADSVSVDVVASAFLLVEGQDLDDQSKRTVSMFRRQIPSGSSQITQAFTCP